MALSTNTSRSITLCVHNEGEKKRGMHEERDLITHFVVVLSSFTKKSCTGSITKRKKKGEEKNNTVHASHYNSSNNIVFA